MNPWLLDLCVSRIQSPTVYVWEEAQRTWWLVRIAIWCVSDHKNTYTRTHIHTHTRVGSVCKKQGENHWRFAATGKSLQTQTLVVFSPTSPHVSFIPHVFITPWTSVCSLSTAGAEQPSPDWRSPSMEKKQFIVDHKKDQFYRMFQPEVKMSAGSRNGKPSGKVWLVLVFVYRLVNDLKEKD